MFHEIYFTDGVIARGRPVIYTSSNGAVFLFAVHISHWFSFSVGALEKTVIC